MFNRKTLTALAAATLLTPIATASAADHHKMAEKAEKKETVVGIAAGNENFTTLVAAVKAADLVETLSGEGPFTVFAPVNDAFAALPAGTVEMLLQEENKPALQTVLTYHVVAGDVRAADLVKLIRSNGGSVDVKTVEGSTLTATIKDGGVVLKDVAGGEIKVVNTDIEASNGVIHVIDGVLLPTKHEGA